MNLNTTRFTSDFLSRHSDKPASFAVHLHHDHWLLNNAKFLYSNQCSSILEDIRSFRIPADFIDIFDTAKVPYYEGRLIVELFDHRGPARTKSQPSQDNIKPDKLDKPEPQRVILHPNDETIWADLLMLNSKSATKLSDRDIIRIEAAYINAIGPPLCLDPDPNLGRIVNTIIRTTSPGIPPSLKRKQSSDLEEDENDRLKRNKMMQYMNPRFGQSRHVQSSHLDKYFGDNKTKYQSKAPAVVAMQINESTVDLKTQASAPTNQSHQNQQESSAHPNQQPAAQQQQQPATQINRGQQNMSPAHGGAPIYGVPSISQKPNLNIIAQREELKPATTKIARKRGDGETPSPVSATAISKTFAKGKSLLQGNGRGSTPRDSEPNSPATSIPASGAPQAPAEDAKPHQAASNAAPQQAQTHSNQVTPQNPTLLGFQPPLPSRAFLQQPPPTRRKASDAQPQQPQMQQQPQPHPPQQQPHPQIAQQQVMGHQGHPGQAHLNQSMVQQQHHGQPLGPPPVPMTHAMAQNIAAMYAQAQAQAQAQDPRVAALRYGNSNATPPPNGHVAQSLPPRGTPTPMNRPSPHLPHLLPQQVAQQRGNPHGSAQPIATRSPAPNSNGGMPGPQDVQPPQPPSTPAQNIHAATNFNAHALLAQYGISPTANGLAMSAGRGLPQHPGAQLARQGISPQQQQQMMNYPPLNLQQLAFNQVWRQGGANPGQAAVATAHLGRGAPPNLQQFVQTGQLPPQMLGRGANGGKRPPGR